MASTLTLATMTTRVRSVLMEATAALWTEPQVQEAIALAFGEYVRAGFVRGARVKPYEKVGTITPAANAREFSVVGLTGFVDAQRVWYPYYADHPDYQPTWCGFEVLWNADVPSIVMTDYIPDGAHVARIFYRVAHTLNGLASASGTTFPATDEALIVLGAAGHTCAMRGIGAEEKVTFGGAQTVGNYRTLGMGFLAEFRAQLKPQRVAFGVR